MFDKLKSVEKRYSELQNKLYEPGVTSDPELYKEIMKEFSDIEPIVNRYREYISVKKEIAEMKELLSDESCDKELRQLLISEISTCENRFNELNDEIKLLLLPKDPNDDKNVIVEIRAGAGGEEAALFAYVLFRMYSMYSEKKGWKTELINTNETELGGFKEVSFMVNGNAAYSKMKYESGVHRVQRVPETESGGRIHTSTVTVAVLPEADDVEIEINPADLQIDTFRSSGAGGQHINKTESAIRITHIPTGTVVECQDERSQYKNKDKAMKVLKSRLLEAERQKQTNEVTEQRRLQVGTGDRSERIRTYNYPQGRVTDHRIGLTLYKIDDILNGELDLILEPLIAQDRAIKLSENSVNSEDGVE